MCEESHGDDLTAVLRELDIAKAVMFQMQAQLNVALPHSLKTLIPRSTRLPVAG